MKAIFLKEIKSFFNSMLGYVFCAAMIALVGIYFLANNLNSGYPYFSYTIRSASTIMMFLMPLLTMRSFAEEKKSKTDQMLLTTPVKLYQIVVGKFLAYSVIYLIPILVSCICPLIIKKYGDASYLKVDYLSILFMYVYGLIFIAIGLFISSLTESQIIAAVGSFGAVFVIVMWGSLIDFIPSTNFAAFIGMIIICALICLIIYSITKSGFSTGIVSVGGFICLAVIYFVKPSILSTFLSSMLNSLDYSTALSNVAYYNILDITGIVMYISTVIVFLMLTVQALNKRRYS